MVDRGKGEGRETESNVDHTQGAGSRDYRDQQVYRQQEPNYRRDFKLDQKTIIWIIGVGLTLINGYLLNRFSQAFDESFEKSIENYRYRIEQLERRNEQLEQRTRDIEVRLGGKK